MERKLNRRVETCLPLYTVIYDSKLLHCGCNDLLSVSSVQLPLVEHSREHMTQNYWATSAIYTEMSHGRFRVCSILHRMDNRRSHLWDNNILLKWSIDQIVKLQALQQLRAQQEYFC